MEHLTTILTVLGVVYPPLLYILPPHMASKINVVVTVGKAFFNALDKAQNTKAGLSNEIPFKRNVD